MTAFSDQDPVTVGGDQGFKKVIPGAKGQKYVIIKGRWHFLQEEKGVKLAEVTIDFINENKLQG
ncbi:MAG: haloalkane dehalogenase [Arenicella sp.]